MRMLKRTSKHHQPAHLAAAIALGIVVGLVPKANLLAVGLYALLLLLPLHTALALAVSVLVACVASYLDPLTGALGSWLLHRSMLSSLWYFLDNTAVLPWLGLHNTVVLGSLVSGIALAAPSYWICLRQFERKRSSAAAMTGCESDETIFLAPQPPEPAIVPPPKFVDVPKPLALPTAEETCDRPAEEESFEPAREVAAIINSWHMAHAADKSMQPPVMSAASTPAAHGVADRVPPALGAINPNNGSSDENFRPRPFTPPPLPWAGERSEIVDSLDLAHNASEVLAWVDDMLEDCLSEDSARFVAHDLIGRTAGPVGSTQIAPSDPLNEPGIQEEHWLMETTIEVVRWGEESPPSIPPTVPQATSEASQTQASPTAQSPISPSSVAEPSRDSAAQSSAVQRFAPRAGDAGVSQPSTPDHGRPTIVQFIQPGFQTKRPALPENPSHDAGDSEPPRGESLGFLLGHLRQEREGRSS